MCVPLIELLLPVRERERMSERANAPHTFATIWQTNHVGAAVAAGSSRHHFSYSYLSLSLSLFLSLSVSAPLMPCFPYLPPSPSHSALALLISFLLIFALWYVTLPPLSLSLHHSLSFSLSIALAPLLSLLPPIVTLSAHVT